MGIATTSKILWHFTGGPIRDSKSTIQTESPKPDEKALENLKSILRSRNLKVGSYKEKINFETVDETMESAAVSCLSDIPLTYLAYHSKRYGKFAIGFKRQAAQEAKFNPVLYIPWPSFASVNIFNLDMLLYSMEPMEKTYVDKDDFNSEIEYIRTNFHNLREAVSKHISLVKTFDKNTEYDTVYSEREWRSIEDFRFKPNDVAMVIVPRVFVEAVKNEFREFAIFAWEDLIED